MQFYLAKSAASGKPEPCFQTTFNTHWIHLRLALVKDLVDCLALSNEPVLWRRVARRHDVRVWWHCAAHGSYLVP